MSTFVHPNPLIQFGQEARRRYRNRREQEVATRVARIAGTVATSILDQYAETKSGPFHVEIGDAPRGTSTDRYVYRIQNAAIELLGNTALAGQVVPNHQATYEACTEPQPICDGNGPVNGAVSWIPRIKSEDLAVVFDHVPTVH